MGSRDIQTFNGTARDAEHGTDVPVFVASCVFNDPARKFAARQHLTLIDVNLLGFWNSGTSLASFLDLDIGRSGTNRRLHPDHDSKGAVGPGREPGDQDAAGLGSPRGWRVRAGRAGASAALLHALRERPLCPVFALSSRLRRFLA
ncbi:hypothetical protein [Streptomyces sp. NBC_00829]|uniref:hypothetical protein n=1 Tax=Streptomyces sp. NBC_00829 TaxID=2903679 RepID=UPI003863392D|nr:restriction endonuclease [Streptomyces sp. NBC_00829]